MAPADGVDVLVVSVAGTIGWSRGARELADGLARAGARAVQIEAARPRDVRTLMLTDLREAYAARRAALRGIVEHRPRSILYCSITSALLWPRPGAICLDATAAVNRRGRHGIWQRPVERRRLAAASLVLGWTEDAVHGARDVLASPPVVVHLPVEARAVRDDPPPRDLDVVAYVADPAKRRLDLTLAAWRLARREGEKLVVAGTGGVPEPGVEYAGRLEPEAFRALLGRARVFLATPREEEYGVAALEALADGAQLVTTPVAAGAYPALALATALDPRLVAEDAGSLAAALRAALDEPLADYAGRAAQLLEPFRRSSMSEALARDVLPRLVPGWQS